ncbi:hypothetical protein [Hydrogenimonas sp.]
MKRWWPLAALAASLVFAADGPQCRGCAAGKLMLQCDYYVVRGGDLAKRHFCEEYAKVVDIDGASAKAAWYWLLAGKPEKALDAAKRAMAAGQTFAAGYAAQASVMLKKPREAKSYLEKFRAIGTDRSYFRDEVAKLRRLYPNYEWEVLLK